ncbi:MAG: hypothetical protein WKF86_11505, partial [Acidimicrobiales bacterium]
QGFASARSAVRPGPVYRVPVNAEPGAHQAVSILVPIGLTAYRPEVVDPSGAVVATGRWQRPQATGALTVGLLSDRPENAGILQSAAGLPVSLSSRFRDSIGFPTSPVELAGLDVILIDDFDSDALDEVQHRTLHDFVALGGSLVIAGGEAAARTTGGLADELVPLVPNGSGASSLAAFADLVGRASAAENALTMTVATGELRAGRIVLAGAGGRPLIVESLLGGGRVIQLAYDPLLIFATGRAASTSLLSMLLSVPLLRAADHWDDLLPPNPPTPSSPAGERLDPLRPLVEELAVPARDFDPLVLLLLAAYALAAGCALFILGRRKSGFRAWAVVPVAALTVAATLLTVDRITGTAFVDSEISVERAAGAVGRLEAYHLLGPRRRGQVVATSPSGDAVAPAAGQELLPKLSSPGLPSAQPSALQGAADASVRLGPDENRVELEVDNAGDARSIRTLSTSKPVVILESHLRLQVGRLVGSVTNHGMKPVRRLRAQSASGGRAELATVVEAGATVSVEAAFSVPADPVPRCNTTRPVSCSRQAEREGALLEAAGRSVASDTIAGQVVLVGMAPSPATLFDDGEDRRSTSLAAVTAIADLESVDSLSFDLGFGLPRLVARGEPRAGAGTLIRASVYDLSLPKGFAGTFTLAPPPGPRDVEPSAEVFDFDTLTWRTLRSGGIPDPLGAGEVSGGVVRARLQEAADAQRPLNLAAGQ